MKRRVVLFLLVALVLFSCAPKATVAESQLVIPKLGAVAPPLDHKVVIVPAPTPMNDPFAVLAKEVPNPLGWNQVSSKLEIMILANDPDGHYVLVNHSTGEYFSGKYNLTIYEDNQVWATPGVHTPTEQGCVFVETGVDPGVYDIILTSSNDCPGEEVLGRILGISFPPPYDLPIGPVEKCRFMSYFPKEMGINLTTDEIKEICGPLYLR